jgi:hypothetical protein
MEINYRLFTFIIIFLYVPEPCCIVTNLFVIKPTRCISFTNLLCHELSSRTRMDRSSILVLLESCLQTCDIYHCWVYSE